MKWRELTLGGLTALVVAAAACGPGIAPMKPKPLPKPATSPVQGSVASQPAPPSPPNADRTESVTPVRVALTLGDVSVSLSATGGDWSIYDRQGDRLLIHAGANEQWNATWRLDGATLKRGAETKQAEGDLIIKPRDEKTFLLYQGKRYRGEFVLAQSGRSLVVINRLPIEQYLRGVVPLEIGMDRTEKEIEAVRAQAIAARSYTYKRLNPVAPYDLTGTVSDQVYGGVDTERPLSDAAVLATRHQVLMYRGEVISAPYHSNSGGCTAAPSEVWRGGDLPYLIPVRDTVAGSDRFYCEDSPRFRWTRTFDASSLDKTLNRYLRQYGTDFKGTIHRVNNIKAGGRTASGRLASVIFETDRGKLTVSGDKIRFVLRTADGAILPSTMFSFDVQRRSGRVTRLTIQGTGNGHGVGMDQWGAISRARSGQDYRTILTTYYPGTTIGFIS